MHTTQSRSSCAHTIHVQIMYHASRQTSGYPNRHAPNSGKGGKGKGGRPTTEYHSRHDFQTHTRAPVESRNDSMHPSRRPHVHEYESSQSSNRSDSSYVEEPHQYPRHSRTSQRSYHADTQHHPNDHSDRVLATTRTDHTTREHRRTDQDIDMP